jgi:hypothetical protein
LKYLEGLRTVSGGLHREAAFFKEAANGMPDEHGVIYNQSHE